MKHDDETLQAAIDAAMHETRKNNSCKSFAACKKSWPKSWLKESPARLALAKAFLAKLDHFGESNEIMPQPILADDGRSLGRIAQEACDDADAKALTIEECYEAAAQAVANVVLAQAIRRMEAVPVTEMWNIWGRTRSLTELRARLIAAAMGEERPLMTKNIHGDQCPLCGAKEVESNTPRTTYACGSSDYDGRPETFHPGDKCESVGINGLTEEEEAKTASVAGLSKPDSTDWKAKYEQAETERKKWEEDALRYCKNADYWKSQSETIGILRQLSEAGPVPDGCVRVTALKNYEDEWAIGDSPSQRDTHFADIRLPSNEIPAVTEAAEIEAMRNELNTLRWTPITERLPTIEDGNEFEDVEWSDGKSIREGNYKHSKGETHWRRITLP